MVARTLGPRTAVIAAAGTQRAARTTGTAAAVAVGPLAGMKARDRIAHGRMAAVDGGVGQHVETRRYLQVPLRVIRTAMVEPTDGDAIRRVRQGDVDAFGVLVTRYRRQYGRYAVALTGDADSAADAMQEAFIRAWNSLEACRDPDRFGSWFFRILTNQCHTVRS